MLLLHCLKKVGTCINTIRSLEIYCLHKRNNILKLYNMLILVFLSDMINDTHVYLATNVIMSEVYDEKSVTISIIEWPKI